MVSFTDLKNKAKTKQTTKRTKTRVQFLHKSHSSWVSGRLLFVKGSMKSSRASLIFLLDAWHFCLCSRQTSSARQKGTSAAPRLQSGPRIKAGENHCHYQNYPSVRDGRVSPALFVGIWVVLITLGSVIKQWALTECWWVFSPCVWAWWDSTALHYT